jgi:hypothetical protein
LSLAISVHTNKEKLISKEGVVAVLEEATATKELADENIL